MLHVLVVSVIPSLPRPVTLKGFRLEDVRDLCCGTSGCVWLVDTCWHAGVRCQYGTRRVCPCSPRRTEVIRLTDLAVQLRSAHRKRSVPGLQTWREP